jgi:hypothetical protein
VIRVSRLRNYLTLGWMAFTLFAWGSAVGMVFLGRWQLDVSNSKHFDLQNFGYAFQWWAFSGAALWFWFRAVRDRGRVGSTESTSGELVVRSGGVARVGPGTLVAPATAGGESVTYRGYVMPQSGERPASSEGDPMHGEYNDYLWQLGQADEAEKLHRTSEARPLRWREN